MKRLIFINGTMGAGKTATCRELLQMLNRSVLLDGDWCWMMRPFVVTDETKKMVQDNIVHLLRNFLSCSEYENVIFCWVMQYDSILRELLEGLKDMEFAFYPFTLMVSAQTLSERIGKDVADGIRTSDVLDRSLSRLPLYAKMQTCKVDVNHISARQAAVQIADAVIKQSGTHSFDDPQNKGVSEKSFFLEREDPEGSRKRLSFDEDVSNYDRRRPEYPEALFKHVIRYAGIGAGKQALEVGIGTGKATEPFLKTGCGVTAVEIGSNLTAYSNEKFSTYSNLAIRNLPFEEFRAQDGSFDLLYSATAFHWIPEDIGFEKAFRLLKSGGTLALWWNRPWPDGAEDELQEEIQRVYQKYWPDGSKPEKDKTPLYQKIKRTILSYGFEELDFQLYHSTRTFDADAYVELLDTYSDHRSMPADKKEKFKAEIKRAIRIHGNRLTICDTVDCYLAKKP